MSHSSLSCHHVEDFKNMADEMHNLVEYDYGLFAHIDHPPSLSNPNLNPPEILNISYPKELVDCYVSERLYTHDDAISDVVSTQKPICWRSLNSSGDIQLNGSRQINTEAAKLTANFDVNAGWMHAVADRQIDLFFMVGSKISYSDRVSEILEYITPFFSNVYRKINGQELKPKVLTKREVEVLNWIKDGKGSWEISIILNCSKRTIDFHSENIIKKLNAKSRAQAVAIGLQNGCIHF